MLTTKFSIKDFDGSSCPHVPNSYKPYSFSSEIIIDNYMVLCTAEFHTDVDCLPFQ